ncbi:MAG: anaerobic ribonucleoside-triphosphate reductase activating protein [Clostridia bacterium]|nr:anaerobic ribonucleoside-triphosphate reductase activating protein [Clostridia bacterium]
MIIRIAGIENDSIVDGPGFRLAVFTQGCPHRCPGCHNPKTHPFDGGKEVDTDRIIQMMEDNPLLDGITLTGGDPFCQPKACLCLAQAAKKLGLNVWAYSGWTFEELMEKAETDKDILELLSNTDVLIDGPFILAERTLELRFRGSRNQRQIDCKKSLSEGRAVELAG